MDSVSSSIICSYWKRSILIKCSKKTWNRSIRRRIKKVGHHHQQQFFRRCLTPKPLELMQRRCHMWTTQFYSYFLSNFSSCQVPNYSVLNPRENFLHFSGAFVKKRGCRSKISEEVVGGLVAFPKKGRRAALTNAFVAFTKGVSSWSSQSVLCCRS